MLKYQLVSIVSQRKAVTKIALYISSPAVLVPTSVSLRPSGARGWRDQQMRSHIFLSSPRVGHQGPRSACDRRWMQTMLFPVELGLVTVHTILEKVKCAHLLALEVTDLTFEIIDLRLHTLALYV